MEILKLIVMKFLCQGFLCVPPSFCVLSGGMKAHILFFSGDVTAFLLPDIAFSQCYVVHNPVVSIKVLEAVSTIIVPWETLFFPIHLN